jgi:hypothetical protein
MYIPKSFSRLEPRRYFRSYEVGYGTMCSRQYNLYLHLILDFAATNIWNIHDTMTSEVVDASIPGRLVKTFETLYIVFGPYYRLRSDEY